MIKIRDYSVLHKSLTLLAANYFAHGKTDAKFILGVKRIAKG